MNSASRDRPSTAECSRLLAGLGPVVDAHHHLWDLESHSYPWLQGSPVKAHFGDYAAIRKSYLPADYQSDARGVELLASVHVEAHWQGGQDPAGESRWLESQCHGCNFPTAIIGHADLAAADVGSILDEHGRVSQFRGVRIMCLRGGAESGRRLLRSKDFQRGVAQLAERGLRLELQMNASLGHEVCQLARAFPQLPIMVIHAALPLERQPEGIGAWRGCVAELSGQNNIHIKLSGLPMCDWQWTPASLGPFVHHLVDCFGPERVVFGSNFPVDSLFSDYSTLLAAYLMVLDHVDSAALHLIFRESANHFYALGLNLDSYSTGTPLHHG